MANKLHSPRRPIDRKAAQRAIDILVSLPHINHQTPDRTLTLFLEQFGQFAESTPLEDVATLEGYRPHLLQDLVTAMVDWRRQPLDDAMAELGREEINAYDIIEHRFPAAAPRGPRRAEEPAIRRRIERYFGAHLRPGS